MICKREFRILLKGVAPQCSGMSYIVFYLFYSLFKLLVFYFQQVLTHRKVFFAFLFWFSFFSPQCSGIFIFYFFYSLFKASPALLLTGQVLKLPVWFAENFPFFSFLGLPKKWNILFELDFLQPFHFQIYQCELNLFLQASVSSYLTIHQCFYVLVSDYRIINFISQHGQISYCEMSVTNFSRSWLFLIVHLHLVNVFFT